MATENRDANREPSRDTRLNESHPRSAELSSSPNIHRRDLLKMGATILAGGLAAPLGCARPHTNHAKKVIIAGGGITGLSCGYELMKRGHEVVVLEAAGRAGGHVRTLHEGLADGLYADLGAEQFTKPGYDLYWEYVKEFNLPYLYYPRRMGLVRFIDGKFRTEEDLHDRGFLSKMGFNQREVDFLAQNAWWNLPMLYLRPYVEKFKDEYKPYEAGLNHLDQTKLGDMLRKNGASDRAIRTIGDTDGSALHVIWHAAILNLRGAPLYPPDVYRLKGGNQLMTDTLASKLGDRVRLNAPLTGIEHSDKGVRVTFRQSGKENNMEGDYLVCCMSAVMLRIIPVKPAWPEAKLFAINHVPYYSVARLVFQTKTPFWENEGRSINWETPDTSLELLWRIAEEVHTRRTALMGWAEASTSHEGALTAFSDFYPGKSSEIEKLIVHNWATDPWAMACETVTYSPGQLTKIWPTIIEPVGRVHFAGAYADNLNWGQEAGTRSARRVAEVIDRD
ncbi:MAG: NAD(P)/FAD-dependent oxidoreductase [Acidobacteria bacterium]|nr:MAG: NAD(P)/FAD-dependent oxidoreductase [Acidobacteriota bacterium]